MSQEPLFLYISQSVTLLLLIWSEYLGASPQYKSNAILEILMCGLGLRSPPADPLSSTPPTSGHTHINAGV